MTNVEPGLKDTVPGLITALRKKKSPDFLTS